MKITARVWKFPQDDINTGLIRKPQYNYLPPQEQGKHCMEALDPTFAGKVQPGDIIVAGKNFGCGSSVPVHHSIMALGMPVVLAESFAKLFFSNCIGSGLWPVPCAGILNLVETGDLLEIDTATFALRNLNNGKSLAGQQLPPLYRDMIEAGGEKPYLKQRLAKLA